MKKQILHFASIALILLFTGCLKEAPLNESDKDLSPETGRTISLTATMPEKNSTTKVGLEQKVDNTIELTWAPSDQLQLVFVQGEFKEKATVTIKNISAEGKKAGFDIAIPSGINSAQTFALYGVYGGGGLSDTDPTHAILPTNPFEATSLNSESNSIQSRKDIMLYFASTGINVSDPSITVTFLHLGSLFNITLKNIRSTSLNNLKQAKLLGINNGDNLNWAYNYNTGGQSFDLVTGLFLNNPETGGNYISFNSPTSSLASGASTTFWGWYPPLPSVNWPKLALNIYDLSDQLIGVSSNAKAARTSPTATGKCFNFYAVLNDAGVHFTDNTFSPPLTITDLTLTGDLSHADSGDDFIGMVYTRLGVVYYNQAQLNGVWSGEINLGTGSDPRVAIDANNIAHVVYVNAGKIAYCKRDGVGFTLPVNIESNNAGSCYMPDIAVDGNGFAHITYTDTQGNTGNSTDYPDIMYAVNSSGSFVKTLIYNGYFTDYGGASGGANYYDKGSRIAVDGTGRYFILTYVFNFYKWMGGNDKFYYVNVNSGTANGSGGNTYRYDSEDIYDIAFDGTNIVAFYKTGNVVKTAQLTVSGTDISFTNLQVVTASLANSFTTPATLLALPSVRVLGGISAGNIFMKYNAVENIITKLVKASTVVVVTECAGDVYMAYSGTDNIIRLIKRVE